MRRARPATLPLDTIVRNAASLGDAVECGLARVTNPCGQEMSKDDILQLGRPVEDSAEPEVKTPPEEVVDPAEEVVDQGVDQEVDQDRFPEPQEDPIPQVPETTEVVPLVEPEATETPSKVSESSIDDKEEFINDQVDAPTKKKASRRRRNKKESS